MLTARIHGGSLQASAHEVERVSAQHSSGGRGHAAAEQHRHTSRARLKVSSVCGLKLLVYEALSF
jgi:hypothetical protein